MSDTWDNHKTRCMMGNVVLDMKADIKHGTERRPLNHKLYGLQPAHSPLSQHPMVSDDLPNRILSGTVMVKPNMQDFRGSSVMFEDGTVEDNIDLVVFCTGYTFSFPFLCLHIIPVTKNKVSLYKYIFPPNLERPTLAVIGLIQPLGAIMPISEIQARWATRVFKGLCKLPLKSAMLMDIKAKEDAMAQRYVATQRHTMQVDYVPYMDEIATEMGVCPAMLKLLLTDPRLGLNVIFGPCTPYQFRLCGPGRWEGARQAILTQWERVAQPLKTRRVPEQKSHRSSVCFMLCYWCSSVLCSVLQQDQSAHIFI